MPRRYLFSGSAFGRAEQCPAHAAYPWVDTETVEAAAGTGVHGYMGLVSEGVPRDEALAQVADPRVQAWCAKIDVDQIPRGLAERSMAYDPATGLGRFTGDRQRKYTLRAGEIPMTPDLLVLDGIEPVGPDAWRAGADGSLTVVDWKTTRWDHDPHYDRPQLEINALTAAAIVGVDAVGIAVGVIDEQGGIAWTRGELGPAHLADVARRVRRAVAQVTREQAEARAASARGAAYAPDVRRGHHCRYCGAFLHCPATRAALSLAFAGQASAPAVEAMPGPAYVQVQAAEQWAATAREIIKAIVRERGDQATGDGRALGLDARGSFKLRRVE